MKKQNHYLRYLASAVLLIFTTQSFSQDCKFLYEKKDPKTGQKMVGMKIKNNMEVDVEYYRTGDDIGLQLIINQMNSSATIPAGSDLEVILGNDQKIVLKSNEDAKIRDSHGMFGSMTNFTIRYRITADQAQQIIDNGIKHTVAHLSASQLVNTDIKDADFESSKTKAKCIFK